MALAERPRRREREAMRFVLKSIARAAAPFLIILSSAGAAMAAPPPPQAPIIRSWGTEAGLPQNSVNAIVQSQDGYLWLATRDGLARFDGIRFKVFGLEQGLPSVDISALLEDHEGTLWIGTFGSGLCRLAHGRIDTVPAPSHEPGSDTINCLGEDAAGHLWVGTVGGLRFYQHGQLMEDATLAGLRGGSITGLWRSRDGARMWISSSTAGLFAFHNGRLEPCVGPPEHERIGAESLFEDRQGRLWIGIGNGMVLCRQNASWRIFNEDDGLPFAYVTSITEDATGTIWAGSLDAGLYRFDGTRFNAVRQADGLSADDIKCLRCDREGNLWIGTRTGGLDRLSRRKLVVAGSAQGLTNDFTRSVAQTRDGTLWVGTVGGSMYRGNEWRFEPLRPEQESRVYYYATVFPVLTAPDDSLWWGATFGLLHWQDDHLADCITNGSWIQNASVTALRNDGHGGLWIGTSAGHLEHLRNGQIVEFPGQITRATITSLAVQPDGALWVGTAASGLKFIRAGSTVAVAVTNGLSARSSIRTLYLDGRGALWIGTAGGGMSCWRNGRVAGFSASQGFTPRTVSQIVEDDRGFLWLGSSHGIFKVSKQDLLDCADGKRPSVHCRSFGLNDGMLTEECSGGFCPAGLKTQSGDICISTVKGLVFLNPNEEHDEMPPPKVLLEEALIGGASQDLADDRLPGGDFAASAPVRRRLTIPPGARDLELHYTAIAFSAPEKIGFRYRLEPADKSWTEAGPRRTVYYPRLSPGNFIFHVQACNADGVWSGSDTTLAVTALPYFWETTWFRATSGSALAGLFAGALGLVVRRRYRLRLARLQALNAIQRERLRISKDMHDQVGSVLTQVSQLTDMGLNEPGDPALARKRLERIGNHARLAVQSLDEIVWATNPKNDNLASFAEYVSRFGDEFFEYTRIRCWQEVPAALPALPLRAEVRHNVFLAVREALNNALKHSQCTEVWLKIKLDGGAVTLKIEDNGQGFVPAQTIAGRNGLGNMQARMAECGGRVELSSAPGKGTCVGFIFSIG
ncbi:MAG TPA: two-component regulator propeller domain-containing protein [Candidatus Acidoferrales bacterium]|nr:two-component regulator propeller domain-containing protein [Candidatus Acidoferrales bacterium]